MNQPTIAPDSSIRAAKRYQDAYLVARAVAAIGVSYNDVKVSVAAVDSTAAIPIIAFLLGALDGLIARNERPPYAQYGEPGWVLPYWKPRALSDSTKLDILRALAGVSLRED